MYTPRQIGIPHHARSKVIYREAPPPKELEKVVYCTWELHTYTPLEKDFYYLILPDACGDIIFDLHAGEGGTKVFAMMSGQDAEEINLGRSFHYRGIRFLPGVTVGKELNQIVIQPDAQAAAERLGYSSVLAEEVFYDYVRDLMKQNLITNNHLMHTVLKHGEDLHSVGELEALTGYTRRQLQRIFREQSGYSPHDFLKILRFQNAITHNQHYYADQSHYIREFKRITGMTPRVFDSRY